jgi:hypothetical protein
VLDIRSEDELILKLVRKKLNGADQSQIRDLLKTQSVEANYAKALLRTTDSIYLEQQQIRVRIAKAKEMCFYATVSFMIGVVLSTLVFTDAIPLTALVALIIVPYVAGYGLFWKNYKAYKVLRTQIISAE